MLLLSGYSLNVWWQKNSPSYLITGTVLKKYKEKQMTSLFAIVIAQQVASDCDREY